GDLLDGVGMEQQIIATGDKEAADQRQRLLLERIGCRSIEAYGIDDEIGLALDGDTAAFEKAGDPSQHIERLGMVEFEAGAEDAAQIAYVLGDKEVAFHQAFDAEHAGTIGVAQASGKFGL